MRAQRATGIIFPEEAAALQFRDEEVDDTLKTVG